ncbi:hypothetical protein ACIGXM_14585 [Kitasatospora sp. NPDC052896]|uniref:hypothetical protein n=1 Tax=Kitasatospora sp. NPDC052896 TaxID=3364061 RepID=UPI0037C6191B
MSEPTEQEIAEAREVGISRGWNHANYINAYGKDGTSKGPDYPGWLTLKEGPYGFLVEDGRPPISHTLALRKVFDEAWKEGIKLFRSNKWQDGSPMDKD